MCVYRSGADLVSVFVVWCVVCVSLQLRGDHVACGGGGRKETGRSAAEVFVGGGGGGCGGGEAQRVTGGVVAVVCFLLCVCVCK